MSELESWKLFAFGTKKELKDFDLKQKIKVQENVEAGLRPNYVSLRSNLNLEIVLLAVSNLIIPDILPESARNAFYWVWTPLAVDLSFRILPWVKDRIKGEETYHGLCLRPGVIGAVRGYFGK